MKRILLCLLPLFLAACGLPKESVERSKTVQAQTSAFEGVLSKETVGFERWSASSEGEPFAVTVKRENWKEAYFVSARKLLTGVQTRKETTVDPILKRNSHKDSDGLSGALAASESDLNRAKTLLSNYQKRRSALEALAKNSDALLTDAAKTATGIRERTASLVTASESSEREFPERKDALRAASAKAGEILKTAEGALASARTELSKKERDYGIVADAFATVAKADLDSKAYADGQTKRFGELRTSHAKVLVDMRVDYFAQITRVSWDEDSDFSTDVDYVFPSVQIDAATAQVLDDPKWDETPVAKASRRLFGSDTVALPGNVWAKLKVGDLWAERRMSHDMAEFYVDTSEKYYHKYRIMRNGKAEVTDWVPVGEAEFDSAEDFLGMALVSKAYGAFEDETVKVPAPEGMEFVGNPAYGSWQPSPSGGGFWQWYGQYAFIRDALGGHSYSRDEWETWKRDYRSRKPYFGSEDEEDRYGTGGTVTGGSGHYRGSHYVRTGGVERWRSYGSSGSGSQRGSGPDFRGRGPGGAGK